MLFIGNFAVYKWHSMEMPSSVLKSRKVIICFTEKICSGVSYSAVSPEFSIDGLTMYLLNKMTLNRNAHKER